MKKENAKMTRKSRQKPTKAEVHVIQEVVDDYYTFDTIIKIFKGSRKIAAQKWIENNQKEYGGCLELETWEVD